MAEVDNSRVARAAIAATAVVVPVHTFTRGRRKDLQPTRVRHRRATRRGTDGPRPTTRRSRNPTPLSHSTIESSDARSRKHFPNISSTRLRSDAQVAADCLSRASLSEQVRVRHTEGLVHGFLSASDVGRYATRRWRSPADGPRHSGHEPPRVSFQRWFTAAITWCRRVLFFRSRQT
jgi:hypothetical protein